MKFVSIDIETTGLDPNTCQTIEIGAVMVDTTQGKLSTFRRLINHSLFQGEPYALGMHPHIFKEIADGQGVQPEDVLDDLIEWIRIYIPKGAITVAGKNFGSFDLQFLKKLPGGEDLPFRHRFMDPAMLYWGPTDEVLPNLITCLERAGLPATVTHNAVEDAAQVADLILEFTEFERKVPMFSTCSNLTSLPDIPDGQVTDLSSMFQHPVPTIKLAEEELEWVPPTYNVITGVTLFTRGDDTFTYQEGSAPYSPRQLALFRAAHERNLTESEWKEFKELCS